MDVDMSVDEALEHFRKGARVAAGSTQTHRGKVEISYWANPFPLLKDKDWKDLPEHSDLCQKFKIIGGKYKYKYTIYIFYKFFIFVNKYCKKIDGN